MFENFDYIVVGAGSAGCAVAGRLADSGMESVALLEAGGHDHQPAVTIPMGFATTVFKPGPLNYAFKTEPQPALDGREGFQPRGRGLGGSSSINAMVYVRGVAQDYDRWEALGADGWGWSDVLPYFKRAECNARLAGRAEDAFHGGRGPLHVSDTRTTNPFNYRFIDASLQAGIPFNHDFNGEVQEGVGFYQRTVHKSERWNAARAYLHRGDASTLNGGRANLHVLTGTQVLRIVFEGRRAVGVGVVRDGQTQLLRARREVILSAGSFGSPQLLMLSGIGPGAHLREMGIDVVHDAPGVGQNLQEHSDVMLHQRVFSTDLYGASPRGLLRLWGEWRRYKREGVGMIASNLAEVGAFVKSRADLALPDLQLHFGAALGDRTKRHLHGYLCHVCVLRPHSRGKVWLASADPRVAPRIHQNLLSDSRDMETLLRGVHIVKKIFDQPALASMGGTPYLHGHLRFDGNDDEAIRAYLRARTEIAFHPVGTCRMGRDPEAVVDPQLRVRGVEGLRVADASVMPTLVGGNTNAPTIMIGEKAVDLIRGGFGAPRAAAMQETELPV